jgi:hypothetical protein
MFDWPLQYHMSPKTTPFSTIVSFAPQPTHVAVSVYSSGVAPAVAAVGWSSALKLFIGALKGFQPIML